MRRVTAVATLLAALAFGSCGDDGSSSTSSASAQEVEDASGSIQVAGWQFNESEEAQDAGPVSADWSYFATDADIVTAARRGDTDVIDAAGGQMPQLRALDVLAPIDINLISDYDEIDPKLTDGPLFKSEDGSEVLAVPFSVTPGLTAYDSDRVPEPTSLDALLEPTYDGAIGLFDAPLTIAQIATAQGVEDSSKMTHEELDAAMAYLEELRPNVKALFQYGEDVQLFNRGDITVSLGSFGAVLAKAIEANPAIEFNFLAQRSFIDAWAILGDADQAAALNWIDRTLTPAGQSAIVEASGSYPVNPAALDTLRELGDPVSVALSELTLNEILESAPPDVGVAVEADGDVVTVDELTRAWNDYKASF